MEDTVIQKLEPDRMTYWSTYFFGAVIFIASIWIGVAFGALFGVIGVVISGLVVLSAEVTRFSQRFYILEGGCMHEYKLLTTDRNYVEYDKIEDIRSDQSLVDRMLGVGDIIMETANRQGDPLIFYGIKDPFAVEQVIRDHMKHIEQSDPSES